MANLILFDNIYLRYAGKTVVKFVSVVSCQKEKIEDPRQPRFCALSFRTGQISVPFGKVKKLGLSAANQISISTGN